jgi:hypothetical protein
MSFSERVEELNQEIGASVERAVSDLRRRLAERLRASNEQMLREVEELAPSLPASFLADVHVAPFADEATASARQAAFSELREGLVAIDRSRSQTEVLTALLSAAGSFASRSAVLLLRGGDVRGWGAHGFNDEADVRGVTFAVSAAGGWGRLAEGQGAVRLVASECAELCSQLESPLAHDGVAVPIVLRDQLAAVLYADNTGAADGADGQGNHAPHALNHALNIEALQTLTYVAAQAIELLPLRERASTATLHLAETGDAAAADAAATAGTHEDEAAGEAAHAPEAPPAETAASEPHEESQPVTALEPQAAPEAEPEPAAWQGGSVAETSEVHWPVEEDHGADELVELPQEEATYWEGKTETWPTPVAEPEPLAPLPEGEPTTPTAPATPAEAPQETVLLQRPSFEPPAAPEPTYPRPVAPLAAASPASPAAAGFEAPSLPAPASAPPDTERSATPANTTPEVRPPSDVEGPGWAFATTRVPVSPDDAELHESARRLARLLVSEIKLYNEDQVEEGRRNRDVYERLKEDIDRSRQMYEERVEPRVWKSTDYFYQELVRILAAGDSRALGI